MNDLVATRLAVAAVSWGEAAGGPGRGSPEARLRPGISRIGGGSGKSWAMRSIVRGALYLIGLGVVAYVWFFVPLGRRTLHEHALRVAETEPARGLGGGAADASRRLAEHVQAQWEQRYGDDAGVGP